ncbi:MAG: S8 family serine peptidase [Thermoplasmatota archaeon]
MTASALTRLRRRRRSPAAALALLVLTMALLPAAGWASPVPRTEVLDPLLRAALDGDRGELDLIVQFRGDLRPGDVAEALDCGFEVLHSFRALPAIRARGPPEAVARLSLSPRVRWVELNERLSYFMDVSLKTINATMAWDSRVLAPDGAELQRIDGEGVTAVVLDSGVDAGHPDLDYGTKTIMNLKSDANLTWIEMENTDTSSGHGTHCAGTIAGNGDASGGARAGVAKGARLIGLSTGEAVSIFNALGALEWVYEHSRPGANPHNIRVVSNSWGTTSEYDHEDAIVQISEKITYENNVVVVFAAGNEGESDHDGSTRTTNPYSLTPAVISVAATEREGGGIASFSSRGLASDNFTWPDIAAPGVSIWSTQARRTLITAMRTQDGDMYYMAISGTSMATPHISGVVALLWQACPSMRVSELRDDFQGGGQYDNASYWSDPLTRMHEAEAILKLTSWYIPPSDENGVPGNSSTSLEGRPHDFAQGYGLVDVHRAVGLALALEKLRREDPAATVLDAYRAFTGALVDRELSRPTDTLQASWRGEWARFDGANGSVTYTNQVRSLFIPQGAERLVVEMQYTAVDMKERYAGTLGVRLDTDGDGSPDYTGSTAPTVTGTRREEIQLQGGDFYIGVDVVGRGFALKLRPDPLPGSSSSQYWEVMIEYSMTATLFFASPVNLTLEHPDYNPRVVPWEPGPPSERYGGGEIYLVKPCYDLSAVSLSGPPSRPPAPPPGPQLWLLGLLALVVIAALAYKRRGTIRRLLARR